MKGGGLRIVAGQWRGRRLRSAPESRPTQERVREALLSRWQPRLGGAHVLELYAGSGAVGLEALSRGAEAVYLVDRDTRTAQENIDLLGAAGAWLLRADLPRALARLPSAWPGAFDLVFADPPYGLAVADRVALLAGVATLLEADGELVLEQGSGDGDDDGRDEATPSTLELVETRRYGGSTLAIYRHRSSAGA